MYVNVESKVVSNAISRCWTFNDLDRTGTYSPAASLAAVEESAFVVGSSSIRALQTRCVMVAVVSMHRYADVKPSREPHLKNNQHLKRPNRTAAALESVLQRISHRTAELRAGGALSLLMLMQIAGDIWALEQRLCVCCLQLYTAADRAQIVAAADQIDDQLLSAAVAFKHALHEECRYRSTPSCSPLKPACFPISNRESLLIASALQTPDHFSPAVAGGSCTDFKRLQQPYSTWSLHRLCCTRILLMFLCSALIVYVGVSSSTSSSISSNSSSSSWANCARLS